jgi:multidrug efflux pump subunit AcrA (membrane-fusion protein)
MKKKSTYKTITVFLFAVAGFLCGCGNSGKVKDETVRVRTYVTIIHPSMENITQYIHLNGVTLFQKKDNIRSTNTGYITSLKFKQGDNIRMGQLFCTLATKEQAALKDISTVDSSLIKFQKPISVLANASGSIQAINVVQGDYISEGDIVAVVNEPASLIVKVNVPYEYNAYVRAGKTCEIILPDGKIISTSISGVLPTVDPVSQSQSFYIRLPAELLPENLNVAIRIPQQQKNNLLCVPSTAVQTDEMQKEFWLMRVTGDSMALRVPVQTGLQNDSFTEIISTTISTKDNIILQGAYGLADSTTVIFDK